MINEQELVEAVERLREGDDNGLLVDYYSVIEVMARDKTKMATFVELMLDGSLTIAMDSIDELFDEAATDLLREAYRTKLEHGAGL